MSIWVKICKYVKNFENSRFWSKFSKGSILVKMVEKSQISQNLSKNLDFGQNLKKNVDFWSKDRQIFILVKILKKSLTLVTILRNFDFGQNSENYQFWRKSNLVKIVENLDFGQNCRKFSILVKIQQNVNCGKIKISMLVIIVGYSRFWSKLTETSILDTKLEKMLAIVKIFVKSAKICKFVDFGQKYPFWSNFVESIDFGEKCRKFSILVKIWKMSILVKI